MGERLNSVYAAVGKFRSTKLLIWAAAQLTHCNVENKTNDMLLLNNIVAYLTGGKCTNYKYCYHYIGDFEMYIGEQDLVFNAVASFKFDSDDFQINAMIYRWNVIFTVLGGYMYARSESQRLLRQYGFCVKGVALKSATVKKWSNICHLLHKINILCKCR